MEKQAVLAAIALTLTGLTGCSDDDKGFLEVSVGVSVCIENSQECQTLRVPNVVVTIILQGDEQELTGRTNESGQATFTVTGTGAAELTVSSPVLSESITETITFDSTEKATYVTIVDPVPSRLTRLEDASP